MKATDRHRPLLVTLLADVSALIDAGSNAIICAEGTQAGILARETFLRHARAIAARIQRQTAYAPPSAVVLPSERLLGPVARWIGRIVHARRRPVTLDYRVTSP